MMNYLVVYNPIAGGGRAKKLYEDLKGKEVSGLVQEKLGIKSFESLQENTITTSADSKWTGDLQKRLANHEQLVIVIGGDGSLMQVASEIVKNPKATLFPVPGGRGNDWVRGLFQYNSKNGEFWTWLLRATKAWSTKKIDLAQVICDQTTTKAFLNMASLGYGGDVVEKARSRRALWSKSSLVYQIEGAIALFGTQVVGCDLTVDDAVLKEEAFFGGFVGNGKANGSGLYWTRNADFQDGKLDTIVFPRPGVWEMLKSLSAVKENKAPVFKNTEIQAKDFTFQFSQKVALELDGEFIGSFQELKFKALPQVLSTFC